MTAVALTEQLKAGAEVSNAQELAAVSSKGPTSVQAISAGSETDIEEEEMAILNDAFAGSTSAVGPDAPPSSDPALLRLVSMGSALEMTQRYKRETKLMALFVYAIFTSGFSGVSGSLLDDETGEDVQKSFALFVLFYFLLNVAVCVAMFIVYTVRSRSEKSFKVYLNELIFSEHTNSEHDIFMMNERQYVGLWMYLSILYTSLFTVFRFAWSLAGDITVTWVATQNMYALAAGGAMQIFNYSVTARCVENIDKQRRALIHRYGHNGLETMDSHIMDELKSTMTLNQRFRPILFAAIYVIAVLVPLQGPVIDWGLYSDGQYLIESDLLNEPRDPTNEYGMIAKVMVWPLLMIDALPWAVVIYFFFAIQRHYLFPAKLLELLKQQLMRQPLPDSIEGFVESMMSWWELRGFYMRCIVQVYVSDCTTIYI